MMENDQGDEVDYIYKKPLDLFEEKFVKMCAPMVRYSKMPFRMLVRKYDCDLAFTPMIIANSFIQSLKARDSEFTTCREDRPLIVQFAANNSKDFADAAEIVTPYSDGVDLNCGCPQRWAMTDGYGACLIKKPELIKDMVQQVKSRVCRENFTVSIKIRIHDDLRDTVNMCQMVEKAGVSWIAVHGRTKEQRSQPVNWEAIKLVKENVRVPVIANGDLMSIQDVFDMQNKTGVAGVMAARGMLQNPAMYAGHDETPLECVSDWLSLSMSSGTPFQLFHHHLMYMLEKVMSKAERRIFNTLSSTAAVLDYLQENYELGPMARKLS
ncbi:hypothetical protein CHS0354_029635 [Potamilus streckersoni]|uniref:tRNA-dihydrouridine synthase n=1 Tax=Potamilus streckersoni TaxID=2493646 RepID=A0AAE0VIB5_9BIVA|nr:hypothetical protein CHS0354_029635 [Potamilus streckersoni]